MLPKGHSRRFILCLLLSLLAAPPRLVSANSVQGTVTARLDDRRVPIHHATVVARLADGDVVAVTRTDREGRFLLTGISFSRVALSVEKYGYFTRAINGRPDTQIVLDCSNADECAQINFDIGRSAVATGIVLDEFGEPLEAVYVSLQPVNESGEGNRSTASGSTDDRGIFRIAGIAPGRFRLRSEVQLGASFLSPKIEGEPVDVELDEGDELYGIQILVHRAGSPGSFLVAGKVTGLELSRHDSHFINMQRLPGHGLRRSTDLRADGSFAFENVDRGRYLFFYSRLPAGLLSRSRLLMGVVQVDGDVSGVVLKPMAATGFSGVVRFESSNAPERIHISVRDEDGMSSPELPAERPGYGFEVTDLLPGAYTFNVHTPTQDQRVYIKGIRRGDHLHTPRGIKLSEGQIEKVEIVVSAELSRITGRVKGPTESGQRSVRNGAQFRVGLWGPEGVRFEQADQFGRFRFTDVVPGDYRIAAWAGSDLKSLSSEKAWDNAGPAARKFQVDPSTDIEIELTALP